MPTKTLSFTLERNKLKPTHIVSPIVRVFKWRWISVLLLGICGNTLINVIFDYKYQRPLVSISIEEYFNAIIASLILLEGTRWISKKLNNRLPWASGILKRLSYQVMLGFFFLVVVLNALVISITYFFYGGFYEFDELMVINISMISMTLLFSTIDSGIYLFKNWPTSHEPPEAQTVSSKKPIQITLGRVTHLIKPENIQSAISQSGSVFIITKEGRNLIYNDSLDALMKNLDPEIFFRANRQTILTHEVIKSTKSLEYGKVEVALNTSAGQPQTTVISRTKAAQFRKWLRSKTV